MRRTGPLLAVVLLIFTVLVAVTLRGMQDVPTRPAHPAPVPVDDTWVMGYYVGYLRDDYPVHVVDWDAMTHVAVGAVVPRGDGTLDTTFFLDEELGPTWAAQTVEAAHEHGVRAVLMVGGEDSRDAFAQAAGESERHRLVGNILEVVDRYGFDGVDVDWEPMTPEDGPSVIALGRDLRQARPDLDLTVALGPVNVVQDDLLPFVGALSGIYDRLNLMTYGLNGGWRDWQSWHGSPLSGSGPGRPVSIDSSVREYLAAGVPAGRLGLGIGFFGSCMEGVTEPRQSSPDLRELGSDNDMSLRAVQEHYVRADRERWDDVAKVPYLTSEAPFGPLGCTYVSYENERSILAKAEFARGRGLGGAIIWNINQGYLPNQPEGGRDPFMEAVRAGFLGEREAPRS